VITRAHRVVAVLTGHVLKIRDAGGSSQRDDFAQANRPIEIDADVRAVARVLQQEHAV
jgi:hypothetical protein